MLKEKEIFLHLVLLFLVSFFSNQYYGFIGLNPFDSSPVYNAGVNILNGKIPFKDYWLVHGPIIDFFQVIFFKIIGVNWSAFVIHSSIFNFIFGLATYFTLLKFKLDKKYSLFYSLLLSLIFYPTVGTPFADQHASMFSVIAFFSFILAIKTKELKYWLFLPWLLLISFFCKQTPSSYVAIIIFIFGIYYFIIDFNKKNFLLSILSALLAIAFTLSIFLLNDISISGFYEQYVLFASSIGKARLDAEFLFPLEFNRYFSKFKLIHISQLILVFVLLKNLIQNKKFTTNDDFIILGSLISLSYIFIVHQLMTLNVKFIYFLIPIMAGFSHIYFIKYFGYRKKIIFSILIGSFIFTSYYFIKYVDNRKFIVHKEFFDKKKIVKTTVLDKKNSEFNWISNLNQNPNDELNDLKKTVLYIKDDQLRNNHESIVITDYQFIFSKFDIKNILINKWYHPGVSYPVENGNQYFGLYKNFFLEKIRENNIKKIYFIKPSLFKDSDYFLKIIFSDCNLKKTEPLKSLIIYDLKNCL